MIIEAILGLLALNIIFYWRTFQYSYVSDDAISAERPPEKNKWLHYFWVLEGKLKSMSFTKLKEIERMNVQSTEFNKTNNDPKKMRPIIGTRDAALPGLDHIITTVLHALVAVGIFLGFGANPVSLLAAVLFSVCPMNNQGAIWISSRGYVLAALGMVWAMALPLWVGGIALLVATYCNAGFFMPLVLLGTTHWPLIICAALCWTFWLPMFKKNVVAKMNMEVFVHDKAIHPGKIILAIRTFAFYLIRSIIPRPCTFYHYEMESISGSKVNTAYKLDKLFWTGAISLVVMLAYVVLTPWNMVSLGLLWFCLGIAPFCNFYRMQQELADRYVYVANVGLMIVLATAIIHWPIVVGIWIGAFALTTWQFMSAYRDDTWLVEVSRINEPNSWFAWHISAMKRMSTNSITEAMNFWVRALMISPHEFKVLLNIASCLVIMGNNSAEPRRSQLIQEGLEWAKAAEKDIPKGQEKTAGEMLKNFREGRVPITV